MGSFRVIQISNSDHGVQRCKDSRFYSLPSEQAVASMYQPKCHINWPENIFDEQDLWLINYYLLIET